MNDSSCTSRFENAWRRAGLVLGLMAVLLHPAAGRAQPRLLGGNAPLPNPILRDSGPGGSGLGGSGLGGSGLRGVLDRTSPSGQCEEAIRRAELQYRLPPGMLFAISLAESGRTDPVTHRARPWPWSVQAGDTSMYFDTKPEAIRWVQDARARGVTSIDTGCLQINLFFHPQAFETVDLAFDPPRNADYAARFLLQLHAATNDWAQAIGFYHSRTPALAGPYQQRVQQNMNGSLPAGGAALPKPVTMASQLGSAWRATLGPPEPPAGGSASRPGGNGWDTLLGRQPRLGQIARMEPGSPLPQRRLVSDLR